MVGKRKAPGSGKKAGKAGGRKTKIKKDLQKKRKYEPIPFATNRSLRTCVCSSSVTLTDVEQKKCKKLRKKMDKLIETQLKILKQNELTLQKLRAQQGTVRVPKCFCDRPLGERKHCEKVCRRSEWLKQLGVPLEREGVKNPKILDIRIAKVHFSSDAFVSAMDAELGKSHLKDSIVGGKGSKDDPANVPRPSQNLDDVAEKLNFQERKISRCVRETKIKEESGFMTINGLKPWEAWQLTERLNDAQEAALGVEKHLAETDDSNIVLDDDELDKYYDLKDELLRLEKERNLALESMNAEIKQKRDEIGKLLKPSGKKRYIADSLHKPKSKPRQRPGQRDARHTAKKAVELAQAVSKLNSALEGLSSIFGDHGMWWISDAPRPIDSNIVPQMIETVEPDAGEPDPGVPEGSVSRLDSVQESTVL
mmetsp:Transcript_4079/g.4718  ORF Transcript_4079/g.4718 Transcript_4079/m.4718 type:complete len:423 (-) Transcript_4079:78-1346(-)|eukprot:CAMPEP_0184016354 /NCGR_PEP_ID=MMETSP0954-20121128/6883_1 /TAXON_ID=627963 /ORGANISM="Aplanochytrium sp, Strain PBS07" /LENGTH=422 /DNA_ID=CAMNT_0026297367 /DNA_START=177 /DNA_END=1445 /DNA_ORIENTATION=-